MNGGGGFGFGYHSPQDTDPFTPGTQLSQHDFDPTRPGIQAQGSVTKQPHFHSPMDMDPTKAGTQTYGYPNQGGFNQGGFGNQGGFSNQGGFGGNFPPPGLNQALQNQFNQPGGGFRR